MFPTACLRTQVKKRLNRTGARTQPCLTPLEMVKGSDCSPLERTCPVISSWKRRIANELWRATITSEDIPQSLSIDGVKSLVRPMDTEQRSRFYLRYFSCSCLTANIMSTVLRPGRNPHGASGTCVCGATRYSYASKKSMIGVVQFSVSAVYIS